MMTTTLTDRVRGYVDQVRTHMADLPADDVDDLLFGLTADLTEALLDGPPTESVEVGAELDLASIFGPPAEYAAELRRAAGLHPDEPKKTPSGIDVLRGRWRGLRRVVGSARAWGALRDFLVSVRPAWWVLRGLAFGMIALVLVSGIHRQEWQKPVGWLFLGLGVVASVQWARYSQRIKRTPRRWMAGLVNVAGVAGVLASVSVIGTAQSTERLQLVVDAQRSYASVMSPVEYYDGATGDGVWVDGMQVSNLFVYDAKGDPVPAAQIVDDRGRPVRTVPTEQRETSWSAYGVEGDWLFQPASSVDARDRWNVYPLQAVRGEDTRWDDSRFRSVPNSPDDVHEMPWPFEKAPEIAVGPTAESEGPGISLQSADGAPTP